MLTKDLLRFRRKAAKIIPQYVKNSDPKVQSLCNDILAIIHKSINKTKKELDKEIQIILYSHKDLKLSKGILKTIFSECIFNNQEEFDFYKERQKLFKSANELLKKTENMSISEYRDAMLKNVSSEQQNFIKAGIFSDHPDYECLKEIKDNLSAEFIINKYNSWLLQSLIIYANTLEISFKDPNTKLLRNFIGKLRFHRLLCRYEKKNKSTINLIIDGPLNILENSQKYGLQLAIVLPYVYQFTNWELKTKLTINKKEYILTANEQLKIKPTYKHQNDYIPEEIKLFGKLFKEKSEEWSIALSNEIITINSEQTVFPDFTFSKKFDDEIKSKVNLELFHRWHSRELEKRLDLLIKNKIPNNMMIGVDRFLIKNNENIAEKFETASASNNNIFLYNNFPTVTTINKILKNF